MAKIIENPKELIMSNAKEIILKEGYSKLSMRALSKACDIAIGTIYNYYPNKKDLIVGMMIEYWEQFFININQVNSQEITFLKKLNNVFTEMKKFIKNFRQVWLKPELYSNPDYIEGGLEKQNIFIERLVRYVETLVVSELNKAQVKSQLSSYEISKFIVMNFISIIQMPYYEYKTFEKILLEILNTNI